MKKYLIKILSALLFFSSVLCIPVFSETAEPYTEDEFPVVLKDIRRAEIITLGSMPFITISTSLGWSFGRVFYNGNNWNYFVNPFSKTSSSDGISSYTTDEQVGIIITSLCICAGIGVTDYIYHVVKRNRKTKKIVQHQGTVIINPVTEDPSAKKLPVPDESSAENKTESHTETENTDIQEILVTEEQ